jgi:anti-sigma regulatory factor (Ser/Thr protein kinase)
MSEPRIPWKRLALEIESRLDAVALPGQVVYLLCMAAGFAPIEGSQVEVCVAEAINNSIKHAYQDDPNCRVELEVFLLPHQLIVDVWDSGISADAARMHADHSHALEICSDCIEDVSERGRGLALIQEVMDSFEYTPGTQRNRLRMIKHRELALPRLTSPTPKRRATDLRYVVGEPAVGSTEVTVKKEDTRT